MDELNDNRTTHLPGSPNSGSRVTDQGVILTNVRAGHAIAVGWVLGGVTALARRAGRTDITSNSSPSVLTRTVGRGEISRGRSGLAARALEDRASAGW